MLLSDFARRRAVPLALLALLGVGCSLRPQGRGDRLFARGDFAGAAAVYEEALQRGRADPELLFRLAVIYLDDGGEHARRGEELLRRLVSLDVGGPYRPAASLLLSGRRELGEARAEAARLTLRVGDLESRSAEQLATIRGLRGEEESSVEAIERLQRSRLQLQQELTRAQERLVQESLKVRSLESELEKLKAIDLGRPPSH